MAKVFTGITPLQIEVEDIKNIPQEICEDLDVGDIIAKITSGQKHCYRVSYKQAGVGMCMTYADASCVETVSYDCIDGVWTYNSTDVAHIGGEPAPSGTKLYKHTATFEYNVQGDIYSAEMEIITTRAESLADVSILTFNDYITETIVFDGEDGYKSLIISNQWGYLAYYDYNNDTMVKDLDFTGTTKKFLTDVVVEL